MLKEGLEHLKNAEFEKAYMFFKEHYEKYNDFESYYYMVNIDYFNLSTKNNVEYYQMFKVMHKKAPKKYLKKYIFQLSTLAFDLEDYNYCIDILLLGEKRNILDNKLYILLANAYWFSDKNAKKAKEYIEKVDYENQNQDDFDIVTASTYQLKAIIEGFINGIESGYKIINDMWIRFNDRDLIMSTEHQMLLGVGDDKLIDEFILKEIKDCKQPQIILNSTIEHYEKLKRFDVVLKYVEIVRDKYLEFYKSKEFIDYYYSKVLIALGNHKKAGLILENIDSTNCDFDLKMLILEEKMLIALHDNGCLKVRDLCEEAYEISKDLTYLGRVVYLHISELKFDEALKYIKKIELIDKDYYEINFLYSKLYQAMGDFDKAEVYCIKSAKLVKFNTYIKQSLSVSKNPKMYYKYNYLSNKNSDELSSLAMMATTYLHGQFNKKVDLDKALEYALKAEKLYGKDECIKTVIGNIYLKKGDIQKAVSAFTDAYEYHKMWKMCTCGAAYYAYCLYTGLGMKQDVSKAYDILINIVNESVTDLTDFGLALYVEISIKLSKDLMKVLMEIKSYNKYRYSACKYASIIKIKKELNLDYSDDDKKLKESLKYVSKEEAKHYKKNPEEIYLDNN